VPELQEPAGAGIPPVEALDQLQRPARHAVALRFRENAGQRLLAEIQDGGQIAVAAGPAGGDREVQRLGHPGFRL